MPAPQVTPQARRRRGLWREAPLVLPVALLLFALLGLATLVSYRGAVERFALERENEALALATRIAELAAEEGGRPLERWLRILPPGSALAILDRDGARLESVGPPETGEGRATALDATFARAPIALDPAESGLDAVVAFTPFGDQASGDAQRYLRLDLPARTLAAQSRSLAVLTPLVVTLTLAAALVVTLFFRALVLPYELLLERARATLGTLGTPPGDTGPDASRDELDFLIATFDRALEALGAPAGDLGPLAGAFGRTLDGGFLLLDGEGRLLVATPAAAELLGPATPRPGTPMVDALAATTGAGDESEALVRALAAGTPLPRSTFRMRGLRAGESERAIGLAVEPLKGEGSRLRGFLVIVADVSESERAVARERLAEGLAQLGELSAGVAHELRNGLAALGGWIQLLSRRPLEPEAAECAQELERETRQLARVVDEFLAFARPGTRRAEPVELAGLIRRVAQAPALGGAPAIVRIEVDPAPIEGDPLLLERALHNLAANAAAASRGAGGAESVPPIELALERAGGSFRIAISDRGPGIPPAIRARLFEPFVTARPGGVGLGLALARRIVLLHGGEIEALDRPGGGTTVRVDLPRGNNDTEGSNSG